MPRVSTASARRCAPAAGGPTSRAEATPPPATRDTSRCAPAAPRDAPHEALAQFTIARLPRRPSRARAALARGGPRARGGEPPLLRGGCPPPPRPPSAPPPPPQTAPHTPP